MYEIGDPANYVMPDVTCDWRGVHLVVDDTTADTVHVSGAVGKPPPPHYKVGMTAFEGRIWLAGLTVFFLGGGVGSIVNPPSTAPICLRHDCMLTPLVAQHNVRVRTYCTGVKATAMLLVPGERASDRAKAVADGIVKRSERLMAARGLGKFDDVHIEVWRL